MDANGALAKDANVEPIKLGSVLPKANFAFSNEFTYKGVSAGFLLSCRLGGIVILPRKQLSTNTEYLKPVQKPATQVV